MDARRDESSNSGFILDSFEGVSSRFTDISVISQTDVSVIARAKKFGRWWILKALSPKVSNREIYRQAQRKELEIMMELQHHAVVTAVGLEEVESLGRCIVMEYIEGQTLANWLKTNPSLRARRDVARQLIDAVAYIHSKSIVHRDLKPSNIMITNNGNNLKIIDFGLSDTDSHSILKQPGGTDGYISPEQRQSSTPDIRNDIYSLGVIFKQLDLKLPATVSRCLAPAAKRPETVGRLRSIFDRECSRRRHFTTFLFLVPLFLLFGLSLYYAFTSKTEAPADISSVEPVVTVRTETIYISSPQVRPVVEGVNSENPQKPEIARRVENIDNIDRFIDKGIRQMTDCWNQWEYKRHIDTLSAYAYFRDELTYLDNGFGDFPSTYCASLTDSLTPAEIALVHQALALKQKEMQKYISSRLKKMP